MQESFGFMNLNWRISGSRILPGADTGLLRRSLLAFGICGLAGVLIDTDHLISYYLIQGWGGRFLHLPVFIISSLVLGCLGAYLGRLLYRGVLR